MELPDPDSLRCFEAAARRLNFRAAAAEVHLTPAALGKRVAGLERSLGARLFQRTTRRVELTEAGLRLLPRAREALQAAAACLRAARGEEGPPPCELVVGTRHELGLSWLVPQLAALERALPGVTLQLYFGSGPDLELRVRTGEVDCAVTSRATSDPALDALPLHEERYVFVGAPALLRRLPLRRPAEASRHTLLDANRSLPLFAYWRAAAPPGTELVFAGTRVLGTIAAIHALVRAGRGVAVLPRYLVAPDLRRRRLRELLPAGEPRPAQFRLLLRRDDPRRGLLARLAALLRQAPLA